ncbi:MAG: hypothetical protein ACYCX3_12305 [Thermoleophilia bacterium]
MTDSTTDELLEVGLVDWVVFRVVVSVVAESLGLGYVNIKENPAPGRGLKEATSNAVRDLLERGLMEAGDLEEADDGMAKFVPWGVGVEEALLRFGELWGAGEDGLPDPAYGWLRNTPEGDRIGHEVRQSRWFDLADLAGVWTSRYRGGSMELVLSPDATFSAVVRFLGSTPAFRFTGEWSYEAGALELRPFYSFSVGANTPVNREVEQLAAYRDPRRGPVIFGRELEFRKNDLCASG